MNDTVKHARLSPSGADGWLNCAAWESDPRSSVYADEGTAAHLLAGWCLTQNLDAVAFLGRVIQVNENEFEVDDEMAAYVQTYVDRIRQAAGSVLPSGEFKPIHHLFIEQAVPLDHLTGEAGATGTSDAIIVTADGEEVQVHDLKYGHRSVFVRKKMQLPIYGAAAIDLVRFAGHDPKRVRLVVHQVRAYEEPDEWELSVEELLAMVSERIANRATTIQPSEAACEWCAKKATCPERLAYLQEGIGTDFTEIREPVQALVPQNTADLDRMYPYLDQAEAFLKAVRAEIHARVMSGVEFKNCKPVAGKRGARKWVDPDAVEKEFKSMRLKRDEAYTSKLISPTQAEKLFKSNPKRWERVSGLITQPEGKPTVAPIDDKRPALALSKPEDDFEALT